MNCKIRWIKAPECRGLWTSVEGRFYIEPKYGTYQLTDNLERTKDHYDRVRDCKARAQRVVDKEYDHERDIRCPPHG